jgi:hypothetical protein
MSHLSIKWENNYECWVSVRDEIRNRKQLKQSDDHYISMDIIPVLLLHDVK